MKLLKTLAIAILALGSVATRSFAQALPYVVNHTNALGGGSSVTRPTGGTLILAGSGKTTGGGCTCPAGWTTVLAHTDGTDSAVQCVIASAAGSDNWQCNGSTTGVDVSEISVANVTSTTTPDNSCASQTSGATFNSCTTTLTHNWDFKFEVGAGEHMAGPTSGISWIDAWLNNDAVGFSSGYAYNVLASNPITFRYELPYASGPTTQISSWWQPSNPPATTVNRAVPYRAFSAPALAGNQSSYTFKPAPWVVAGDVFVCDNIVRSSSITPSCDGAFTPVGSVVTDGAGISGIACVKKAGSNESSNTYTFSLSGTGIQSGGCRTFHNIDTTGAAPYVDASATANSTSGMQMGTAGVTPSQIGDLIVNIEGKAFGESASGGAWAPGDIPFNDGNNIQFVTGVFSAGTGLSESESSIYIQPTASPTGIHNALSANNPTHGWIAWTLAFKLTAVDSPTTVCGNIKQRYAVPMTTDTTANSHGHQLNIHYVPYGAQAGDMFYNTDDTDASTPPTGIMWPFANFTAPTVQQVTSATNSEQLATQVLLTDSPPYALTTETSNIVAYGTDTAFGDVDSVDTSCKSTPSPASPMTGCSLTPAEADELAVDSWTSDKATTVASTPMASSVLSYFSNFATATGYSCRPSTSAYAPQANNAGGSTLSQTLLLLKPSTAPPASGTSVLFGPVCGTFSGAECN